MRHKFGGAARLLIPSRRTTRFNSQPLVSAQCLRSLRSPTALYRFGVGAVPQQARLSSDSAANHLTPSGRFDSHDRAVENSNDASKELSHSGYVSSVNVKPSVGGADLDRSQTIGDSPQNQFGKARTRDYEGADFTIKYPTATKAQLHLNTSAADRAGFSRWEIRRDLGTARPMQEQIIVKEQLALTLARFFQDTSLCGFAAWANALSHCSEVCPPPYDYSISMPTAAELLPKSRLWKGRFGQRHGRRFLSFDIRIRPDESVAETSQPRLTDESSLTIRICANFHDIVLHQTDGTTISLEEELTYLADVAQLVARRLQREPSREGGQMFRSKMAEYLLKVLEFQTAGLAVYAIQVGDRISRSKSSATWKTLPDAPLTSEVRHAKQARIDVGPNDILLNEELIDTICHDYVEHSDKAVETSEPESNARPRKNEDERNIEDDADFTVPGSDIDARTLHLSRHDYMLSTLVSESSLKSEIVSSKTGTNVTWSLAIFWNSRYAESLSKFSFEDVKDSLEKAFAETNDTGLSWLPEAAANAARLLPCNPCVSLRLRASFQNDTRHRNRSSGLRASIKYVHAGEFHSQSRMKLRWAKRDPWTIRLPEMQFKDIRVRDSTEMNVSSARLSITLHGVCIDDGRASQESALSRLDRICELLEPHLADMFRASKSLTLQEAAHECCRIVANLPQPIDGTLQPKMVKAKLDLQAPDDNNAATSATSSHNVSQGASKDVVFVALGSNIGDRCGVLESACKMIDASADMQILRTSPLYETEPMYVEEQESFLNGVCMISTSLAPNELLDRLQAIENDLGRVKLVDKGPRNIDLDIVAYKGEVVNTERLIIPHRLMTEREFVLRPLRDVDDGSFEHPVTGKSVEQLLRAYGRPPDSFTPIAPGCDAIHANNPKRRTRVMAILNVTPDSFSDGGDNQPADVESLKATALSHIAAGATIIDIGGQSSRPNAPDITAEEELARVLPAIEAIKSLPEAANIAISIDTYRASVAEAAINAGAHIVNDISAGLLDPEMFPTVARLGCTYIMTHMRGTPSTMQDAEHTTYTSGLLHGIYTELQDRIEEAQQAGIRRWRIILDPGIGFSKTTGQNLQILRALNSLKKKQSRDTTGYPWLVGSSRKGFIGKVTGAEDAKDRVFGTAATVTAAIQGGADIVRVHDVKEMVQVARMADAIYRRLPGEESWPEEPSGDGNQQ